MTLEDLGYNADMENYRKVHNLCSFGIGHVISEHKERYIVKTNVDFAFIVQAVDRDFNINRIERYLTICNASLVKQINFKKPIC